MKNEEKELCAYVQREFERRSRERLTFELQWRLNINFFLGNQYCDILPEAGRLFHQEKVFSWQERETYNHIAPIVETRLAKLSKITPRVTVRPATNDEEDIQSAKVSTAILHAAFDRQDMGRLIDEGTVWSELCGTVFYQSVWNSRKGTALGMNSRGEEVREGDVQTVVCPPLEIYPDDSRVRSIEDCVSVIHARIFDCDTVEKTWHKRVEKQDVSGLTMTLTEGGGGFGERVTVGRTAGSTGENQALVLEYYEKPGTEYPNGRYIVVSGDTLLYEGDLPYENGPDGTRELPFVQQNAVERPGCLWGLSVVERCIPVQRAYNAVRNRKHEFLNRAAVGVLAVEEGTADLEDLRDNGLAPGKVLVYRQGTNPPTMMNPGSLPEEFTREEKALLEEFNLISGTSDLMRRSMVPTNVTSGIALNAIAEQDDTRLTITAGHIRDAILKISRQWLHLFKQFAGSARLDRIVGSNGEVAKMYWNANMLSSDDVIHETENELSGSLTSRKETIYELLGKGLFLEADGTLSARTKAKLLRALGMGDWENISDIGQVHIGRAQRENQMLKNGGEVRVMAADDHEIHILEHAKMLLSQEFEEAYGVSGEMHRRFEEHIAAHKAMKEENNHEES